MALAAQEPPKTRAVLGLRGIAPCGHATCSFGVSEKLEKFGENVGMVVDCVFVFVKWHDKTELT